MASLEETLNAKRQAAEETKQSLQETLKIKRAEKMKEQEDNLRIEIASLESHILELKKAVEKNALPRASEDLEKEVNEKNEGVLTMKNELKEVLSSIKKLYEDNRDLLPNLKKPSDLRHHKEYQNTDEIQNLMETYNGFISKITEKKAVKEKLSEAKKIEETLPTREEAEKDLYAQIELAETAVLLLKEQLPEEKVKKQSELAALLEDKVSAMSNYPQHIIKNLKFWQGASLKDMEQMLPEEYFVYLEKDGYGRDFVTNAMKEAVQNVMKKYNISKEMAETRAFIEETEYTEKDREIISERGKKIIKEMEEVNDLLKEEIKKNKVDTDYSMSSDPMTTYFISLDLFKGYINNYNGGTKSFLEQKFRELKDILYGNTQQNVPKKSSIENTFSGLENLLNEIKTAHEQNNKEHPLFIKNALNDDKNVTRNYLQKEYAYLNENFTTPAQSTNWYKDAREKGKNRPAILAEVEKIEQNINGFTNKMEDEFSKLPEYLDTAKEQDELEQKFGKDLVYEEKQLQESLQHSKKALGEMIKLQETLKEVKNVKVRIGSYGFEVADPVISWNFDEAEKKERDLQQNRLKIEQRKVSFFQRIFGGEKKKALELQEVDASLVEIKNEKEERTKKITKENKERKRVKELIEPISQYVTPEFLRSKLHNLDLNEAHTIDEIMKALENFYTEKASENFASEKSEALKKLNGINEEKRHIKEDLDNYERSKEYLEFEYAVKRMY
ncbi:MAG: hypothetical protein ACK4NC_00230 [Candidatus Gracilibacteria bacterium]